MSRFTTEVRNVCEFYAGMSEHGDYGDVESIIEESAGIIFDRYPIFDETYRELLNKKILKHYYMREIGFETVGLWKLKLNTKMNEIMPYYNKLYESELLKFNPFYDVDYKTEGDRSGNTESNGKITSSGESERLYGESGNRQTESEENRKREYADSDSRNRESLENREAESKREKSMSETTNQSDEMNGTRSEESKSENSRSMNANGTNKNTDKYSDTPQGAITNLEAGTYLTNARINEGENENATVESGTEKRNNESEYGENRSGESSRVSSGNDKSSDNVMSERNDSEVGSRSGSDTTSGGISSSESNVRSGNDKGKNSGTSESENSVGSVEAYAERVYGKRGGLTYAKMLQEFRDTFLNIDMMIINDLSDLFFGLWE